MDNNSKAVVTLADIRNGNGTWTLGTSQPSAEIQALQYALLYAGYWSGGDKRDGTYNVETVSAVKGFQVIKNILPANGTLNQTTLKSLESWSGTLSAVETTTPYIVYIRRGTQYAKVGDSGSTIDLIRGLLNQKGYTCAPTGAFDNQLLAVVKKFQGDFGLPITGNVAQKTIAVLDNNTSDTGWLTNGTVKLTTGLLARCGFEKQMIDDLVPKLNSALNTYGINTKQKVRHFLAQCMAETLYGAYPMETGYQVGIGDPTKSYSPYCGGGCLHLTHQDAYKAFAQEMNDSSIIQTPTYATVKVAINYPTQSAGWYWRYYRKLDTVVNWNATDEAICTELTTKITGSSSGASKRFDYFKNKICPILK